MRHRNRWIPPLLAVSAALAAWPSRALDGPAPQAAAIEQKLSEAVRLLDEQKPASTTRALALLREAAAAARDLADPVLEARSLEALGPQLDDPHERLAIFERALALRQGAGDEAAVERNRMGIGSAQSELGQAQAAEQSLQEAVRRLQALTDAGGEAAARQALGHHHYLNAAYEKALEEYARAEALFGTAKRDLDAAIALTLAGNVRMRRGELQPAFQIYVQAQERFGRLPGAGANAWRSVVLANIANVQMDLGQAEQAEKALAESAAIQESLERMDPGVLVARAKVRGILGDPGAALDDLKRANALFREQGDIAREASTLSLIAEFHGHFGDWEQSLTEHRRALDMARSRSAQNLVANQLVKVGSAQVRLGRFAEAIPSLREGLALVQQARARTMEAVVLTLLGEAQEELGEREPARQAFEQALALSLASGERRAEITARCHLGRLEAREGRYPAAAEQLRLAVELAGSMGFRIWEAQALYQNAALQRRRGELEDARRSLARSIEIVESMRGNLGSETQRASFLASRQEHYELLVDTLMRLGRGAEAFEVAERARARSLLDSLRERRAGIREGVDAALLAREAELRAGLNARAGRAGAELWTREEELMRRLQARQHHQGRLRERGGAPTEVAAVESEITALLAEYRDLQGRIRAASPRYAALIEPEPARVAEVQQGILDEDTALLEYFLGGERSVAWLVTRQGVRAFDLPGRDEVEAAARRVSTWWRAREQAVAFETPRERSRRIAQADEGLPAAAAALSQMLLGPLAAELAARRLVIVADGALQYLSFGALPLPGAAGPAPLLLRHEIVYAPSASALLELRRGLAARPAAPKAIAVLADPVFGADDPRTRGRVAFASAAPDAFPRLPDTGIEMRNILQLVAPGQGFQATGFAANRAAATSPALAQYGIVHFATHAFVDSERPELSGVVLSLLDEQGRPQDGVLRLHDVYGLELGADMVVLSACRTALGREVRGEGIVGLTRGFLYAGARRVVASLWSSPDEATAELMSRFYRGLLKEGLSPAAALRAAQLSLARTPRWSAPYYWAGFVLQGDWR
jgi:CHAT domain-containing protein